MDVGPVAIQPPARSRSAVLVGLPLHTPATGDQRATWSQGLRARASRVSRVKRFPMTVLACDSLPPGHGGSGGSFLVLQEYDIDRDRGAGFCRSPRLPVAARQRRAGEARGHVFDSDADRGVVGRGQTSGWGSRRVGFRYGLRFRCRCLRGRRRAALEAFGGGGVR